MSLENIVLVSDVNKYTKTICSITLHKFKFLVVCSSLAQWQVTYRNYSDGKSCLNFLSFATHAFQAKCHGPASMYENLVPVFFLPKAFKKQCNNILLIIMQSDGFTSKLSEKFCENNYLIVYGKISQSLWFSVPCCCFGGV